MFKNLFNKVPNNSEKSVKPNLVDNQESKENSTHFKFLRNENGTFGVFEDYPNAEVLLKEIDQNVDDFKVGTTINKRGKTEIGIEIEGKETTFFIKEKMGNRNISKEGYTFKRDEPKYPHKMPHFPGEDIWKERMNFSVMNELLANVNASKKYKEKFNKELPIEKAVGFFISNRNEDRGARFAIFEKISNIISYDDIPDEKMGQFIKKEREFAEKTAKELKEIGIPHYGLEKRERDFVASGSVDNPNFILVDSEDWPLHERNDESNFQKIVF